MKRLKIHCGLAVLMILPAACQSRKAEIDPTIIVSFNSTNAIDMEQFIESVHYVQLENNPESAFTDIDKIVVSGKNMFMLDKRLEAVFCFDTTGRFRYRIQRVGRGPGEYQELEAIWVKPAIRELWLQSFWPSKIFVYDFDGRLLREFGIRWAAKDMVSLGEDLIAAYNSSPSNDGTDSLQEGIYLLGEDGRSRGQALVLGDSSIYWSLGYQRNLEEFGKGALLLSQSDTIFRINEKGKVSPEVYLDWGKLKYPDELRGICFDSPRSGEALRGNYISGKDQLIAFGPVRLFRIFLDGHMEVALADLNTGKGVFSTQMTCKVARVPLLYPMEKSDRGELIGMYDMSLLLAMKESRADRKEDPKTDGFYQAMDSLVDSALSQDRPVLWFAKIKQGWLTESY